MLRLRNEWLCLVCRDDRGVCYVCVEYVVVPGLNGMTVVWNAWQVEDCKIGLIWVGLFIRSFWEVELDGGLYRVW